MKDYISKYTGAEIEAAVSAILESTSSNIPAKYKFEEIKRKAEERRVKYHEAIYGNVKRVAIP